MAADSPFWVPALPIIPQSTPLLPRPTRLDRTLYTDLSAVDTAVANVVRGYGIARQSEVDAMAQAIRDAVKNLVLKGADYTAVDAVITKANALNKDDYTNFGGGADGH